MISRFILITLSIISITTSSAQFFEGKIVYKNSYKSKLPNVPDAQFNSMMGVTQDYFVKGGNYKSTGDGTFFQWQSYINKDNKLYSKVANSESIYWNDGAVNADEILSVQVNKNATEILGHKCDELILNCKSGVQKFYFNSSVAKVDPKLFENHKFANWSEVLAKCKALPLKMVVDNPQFSVESVAVEIKEMKLDDKLFELPAGVKIEKSPF